MRYYDITITDPDTGKEIKRFTSYANELTIRGALNIEFDIPVVTVDTPAGGANLRIWGVDLPLINNASQFNGKNITIKAGMQKGLPLANLQVTANPARNGVLFRGTIFQSFGNWQGLEQTLDFIIIVGKGYQKKNGIMFNIEAGTSIQDGIKQTMENYGIASNIYVSPEFVTTKRITFLANDIVQFAQEINKISLQIKYGSAWEASPKSNGINMTKTESGYLFFDNTYSPSPIKIDFTDCIGQPAWLDIVTCQIKTVLRSDMKVGDNVTYPKSNNINTKKSFSQFRNDINFVGTGQVIRLRHIGNFRQSDANSWITVVDILI